mmetsp:Transcript_15064/g.49063  ORF Transcript_15064/g.49063 Transcript_15064/m.49063 type:complete len:248 (+) Transcript_15064:943-1686(+)
MCRRSSVQTTSSNWPRTWACPWTSSTSAAASRVPIPRTSLLARLRPRYARFWPRPSPPRAACESSRSPAATCPPRRLLLQSTSLARRWWPTPGLPAGHAPCTTSTTVSTARLTATSTTTTSSVKSRWRQPRRPSAAPSPTLMLTRARATRRRSGAPPAMASTASRKTSRCPTSRSVSGFTSATWAPTPRPPGPTSMAWPCHPSSTHPPARRSARSSRWIPARGSSPSNSSKCAPEHHGCAPFSPFSP